MKAMFSKPVSVVVNAAYVTQLRPVTVSSPKTSDFQANEVHVMPTGSGSITAAYGDVASIMRLIGSLSDINMHCLILVE